MSRPITGGPAQPARALTDADLVDNGGRFRLASRVAIPVHALAQLDDRDLMAGRPIAYYPVTAAQLAAGEFVIGGGPALPIYEIDDDREQQPLVAIPVYVDGGTFPVSASPPATPFVGAYDAIPSVVHVYEPARRTLTAYTGNLVRLRRSSDNAESNFGYTANGDLDTAAITTWLGGASGFFVTVYDQKGVKNITQATAGNQPAYVASGQNSKPVWSHATNDHLDSTTVSITQPLTTFAVAKITNLSTEVGNITDGNSAAGAAASTGRTVMGATSSNAYRLFAGFTTSGGTRNTNYHLFTGIFNGASSSLLVDTASVASGNAGSEPLTGLRVGIEYDGTVGQSLIGEIGCLVIGQNMAAGDRTALHAAINSYWSVY